VREYQQFCGLARALELVGGRWSLLVVRELLTGPKRFTELEQGLPGIPTNVLSSRLRELEEAGVVERAFQAPPSRSVVYALTPYGLDLEEPLMGLGLWGARALGEPTSDFHFSLSALAIGLRAALQPERAKGPDRLFEIRFDDKRLHVLVGNGRVSFPPEAPSKPNVVLETAPEVFAELFAGHLDIDSAIASGRARIAGSKREARRFFAIFRLPARETTAVSQP
jgi:DNA-binding HxlR family transcriptional regulator/putative sterol carrier protein